MKKIIVTLHLVVLIFASADSYAKFSCTGLVGNLLITGTGGVILTVGSTPPHGICNLESQGSQTINSTSCKYIFDAILSAKRAGESITVYYDLPGKTTLSCDTLPEGRMVPSAYAVGIK